MRACFSSQLLAWAFGGGSSPGSSGIIQLMKALRMLRLLKLARQYDGSVVIIRSLTISMQALKVPTFFLSVMVIVFASVIYYLEKEASESTVSVDDDDVLAAAFRSIPHAIWFMLVTMTSVGYGDVTPSTDTGKTIAALAMIFGIIFLAM